MLLDGLFVIASFVGVLAFLMGTMISAIKAAKVVAVIQHNKHAINPSHGYRRLSALALQNLHNK